MRGNNKGIELLDIFSEVKLEILILHLIILSNNTNVEQKSCVWINLPVPCKRH